MPAEKANPAEGRTQHRTYRLAGNFSFKLLLGFRAEDLRINRTGGRWKAGTFS